MCIMKYAINQGTKEHYKRDTIRKELIQIENAKNKRFDFESA